MSSQTSAHTSKRSRNSTPPTRRTWTAAEERTLIDGLKALCVNGWRGDNGTFKPGYLKELECYLCEHHPNSGLKGEPHVLSKIRYWKKCYASIAMLKSRSGLGFQYSDGPIIVDDPKFWDDFLKVDPNAKNMNTKKWPMFVDWEKIFGKDRATGEFAEGPLDAVEDIQRSQSSVMFNDMSLGYPIDLDGDEEAGSSHRPNVTKGEAGNSTGATTFPEASQNESAEAFEPEEAGSQQTK
uniref:Myb/SANT-like domain-containing protein n=1 Tax=Solanum lycopersicum TaxID=4081 RepID=A0A3Q7ICG3_SOLLC